jgi:hypothetical protein
MSMQFSDSTNRTGIIELIEDNTGTQSATTSSYTLKTKTRDVNNAYANYFLIGGQTDGRWQLDDTNHTKYPIITTALTTNQQDYTFTVDEQSNQILDIYRVEILDPTGLGIELTPIDQFDIQGQALTEFMKNAATPLFYDKTANGIILYPKPNYTNAAGLKIYYNRTPSYFVSTDTTKTPGIPDIFHEYLALRPSYQYCLRKGLPQTVSLRNDMVTMEDAIKEYYSNRSKDEVKEMSAATRNSH